jgi:hypothetical protein
MDILVNKGIRFNEDNYTLDMSEIYLNKLHATVLNAADRPGLSAEDRAFYAAMSESISQALGRYAVMIAIDLQKELMTEQNEVVMRMQKFPKGLTVAELKPIVAGWSEIDEDGEPREVWVGVGNGLASQVAAIWPLNPHTDENHRILSADLQLEPFYPEKS